MNGNIMKSSVKLLFILLFALPVLIACNDDDSNPSDNNNNNDDPLSCTISGEVEINYKAVSISYSSVVDEDITIRTFISIMTYEGKSHLLNIILYDPNGGFKKNYELGVGKEEAICVFLHAQEDGLEPIQYMVNISGNINFTTLTDTKANGTFNFVAKTPDGSKQITVTNGVINKN